MHLKYVATQLNRELLTQVSDTSKSASSLYTVIYNLYKQYQTSLIGAAKTCLNVL